MYKKDELINKRVLVYYNLHKHTFSVKYKNKVVLYVDRICLSDVEFHVNQRGNQKVRDDKQKNVHAYVIGNIINYDEYPYNGVLVEPNNEIITYNPYKYNTFVWKNTEVPIYITKEVNMINLKNKIFVV
jgi:hypothetical protein